MPTRHNIHSANPLPCSAGLVWYAVPCRREKAGGWLETPASSGVLSRLEILQGKRACS